MKKNILLLLLFTGLVQAGLSQNIGINATGAAPNAKAMLDISSTTTGLLIPSMTGTQRDAITSPPNGLQIYNTTTNTTDVYRVNRWESSAYAAPSTNLVNVYSLADLPTPSGSAITLDATKMYVFSGVVNISSNYLNLNGAGLRGTDPSKDGIMSTASGAVLRSSNVSVFLENLMVIPASGATKAYDFSDATGTKYCNLFSGCSVIDAVTPSLGVGQISGFVAVTITKNYWACKDGIKVTGNIGKFTTAYTFITGISAGSGIEFLSGLTVNDIDLSNNYFNYTGQTGIKVNAGSTIDRGRMTTNMFRGVTTYLNGFDSYTPGWQMVQNTDIPNTKVYGYIFMNNNATATSLPVAGTYYKIAGTTTLVKQQKFTTTSNRITYIGKSALSAKIFVVVGGRSPASGADFTIAIAKNGTVITAPNGSMGALSNGQGYQITLDTEIDMVTNDYVEIFINGNLLAGTSVTISDLQFRVSD